MSSQVGLGPPLGARPGAPTGARPAAAGVQVSGTRMLLKFLLIDASVVYSHNAGRMGTVAMLISSLHPDVCRISCSGSCGCAQMRAAPVPLLPACCAGSAPPWPSSSSCPRPAHKGQGQQRPEVRPVHTAAGRRCGAWAAAAAPAAPRAGPGGLPPFCFQHRLPTPTVFSTLVRPAEMDGRQQTRA